MSDQFPLKISKEEHSLTKQQLDQDAVKVMLRLIRHGYRTYLVGGGVRDLLIGKEPKDFDISTDATPKEMRNLFRNCRIIGRRFKLAHVYFGGGKILEVSTFRDVATIEGEDGNQALLPMDNEYGTPETDAKRRDLTINGLFYDVSDGSIIDFVGGLEDLKNKVVRIIGDPDQRLQEDPVRMIRAVRHAARADFKIETKTFQSICKQSQLIRLCPQSRLYEEFIKDIRSGYAEKIFSLMTEVGLFEYLLPFFTKLVDLEKDVWKRILAVFAEVDRGVRERKELTNPVIFSAMLIGNVKESYFDPSLMEVGDRMLFNYLRIDPVVIKNKENSSTESDLLDSDEELSGESEEDPDEDSKETHRFRNRKRLTPKELARRRIVKLIGEMFSPLVLTRKDREKMEHLLRRRASLLTADEKNIERVAFSLENDSYLHELIDLFRVSGHSEKEKKILGLLNSLAKNRNESAGDFKKKRPSRRRRRRR